MNASVITLSALADLRDQGRVEVLHDTGGVVVGRITVDGVQRIYIAPGAGDNIILIES